MFLSPVLEVLLVEAVRARPHRPLLKDFLPRVEDVGPADEEDHARDHGDDVAVNNQGD